MVQMENFQQIPTTLAATFCLAAEVLDRRTKSKNINQINSQGGTMLGSRKTTTIFLIAMLLMTLTVTNSTAIPGTHPLSASAESSLSGAGSFATYADNIAVAMGAAALFGCVWCAGAAIGLKIAYLIAR
jgi:hypothetical protein